MLSLSIIVPIFNGARYLPAFFNSLSRALPNGAQLITVDDGSTESVAEFIPSEMNDARMIRIRNENNLGYSATVNKGFALCTGDCIIQLNTDLVLDPYCILELIKLIEQKPRVGIVGSKLVFPTSELTQHIGMAFGHHSRRHVFFQLPADHQLCTRTRPMQIMSGAIVALTRQLLQEIGPLDERFFNYNEDVDHCLRASAAGHVNYCCAKSIAYHWVSQSGPARFTKNRESDAIFWSKWAGRYEVDLGNFLKEGLKTALNTNPELSDYDLELLNLCRSEDEGIAFSVLEDFWPGIVDHCHHHRQLNNSSVSLWLPMILPTWLESNPKPFIYLVDSYRQLCENRLWFRNRMSHVRDELIADLTGCVLTSTELLAQGTAT